jgi:hypothetical protein
MNSDGQTAQGGGKRRIGGAFLALIPPANRHQYQSALTMTLSRNAAGPSSSIAE